ncbi:MAG: elongation factor Ts [Rhodospirillaceae bacterium]|nr:elongation factor Ts [Rhodospirillaceae bacterium]|tara:strand:+ start:7834 stop:8757 length:924 start_codon:yes stop_codon:yes gene_type:complete
MAQITASLVKDLREKTGAGMMDCKKALSETEGDLEAAVDWLRKSGLAAAAKKASRVAAEGLVAVNNSELAGAVVEINAETDFVARNAAFQSFVSTIAGIALNNGSDIEAISAADFGDGVTVQDTLNNLIATIGENMNIRRAEVLSVNSGVVSSYIHNATAPGLGRIAVLVALESEGDSGVLEGIGKQLAMHVAAASPRWMSVDEVDAGELDRERTILMDQAKDSGKPEEIIAKMVEGRLRKFYEETVLLEQTSVIDNESKISKVLEAASKEAGAPVELKGFVRFALGEGVEKEESDFAAEVAAAAQA